MDAQIEKLLETFLAERREVIDGGWAEVTGEDMAQLEHILILMLQAKFARDVDGDLPVGFALVNRHESPPINRLAALGLRYPNRLTTAAEAIRQAQVLSTLIEEYSEDLRVVLTLAADLARTEEISQP